jgi:hypothetical protein
MLARSMIWFMVVLLFHVAHSHEPPQYAGALSVSFGAGNDGVVIAKLALLETFGVSLSARFNSSRVVVCASLGFVVSPRDCAPIEPYARQVPHGAGSWWVTLQHNRSWDVPYPTPVENVTFYVDAMQSLEFGIPSRTFDALPKQNELFTLPPTLVC